YGLPWQNAGVTVEGEPGSFKVCLEGKSIGEEGIELGINFDFTAAIENLEGTIHTQSISELFKFLQQHQLVPGDLNAPILLQAIPDLSFSFYQTPALENSKKSFAYTVQDNRQILDLKGEIEVNSEEKILNGTLSVSPVL